MKPANDEIYELAETAKEWFFGLCVTVGALTMFAIALGVTL